MQEDISNLVLSSVHIGSDAKPISGESTVLSEFYYTIFPQLTKGIEHLVTDKDGDIDVPRLKQHIIVLEHTMATPIERVGTQLWSASLLMGDYIIHNRHMFSDAVILELGSGCGFIGIVAGKCVAKHVFCTDINNESILEQCQRNIVKNSVIDNVSVHELDWFKANSQSLVISDDKFTWQSHDIHMLSKTSIILACDVIYDNNITDAFFNTLVNLCTQFIHTPPTIFIALEKRINFTLEDLTPSSPCYDYFLSCLNKHYITTVNPVKRTKWKFDAKLLPTVFISQSFCYERMEQMEIWELYITKEV